MNQPSFDYTNLTDRPTSTFIRISSKLLPGVRKVQAQIIPYAEAWNRANHGALTQEGPLWVVLGDSMAQGVGASAYDHGWVGQLHDLLQKTGKNYRIINLSVSGARVTDVLEQQLPAMREINSTPALVTVLIGSNDMLRKKYRQNLASNYAKLLQQLPPHAVLLSPFRNSGVGETVNELIKRNAKNLDIIVVNNTLHNGVRSWKGKLAEDHFHPNDDGYKEFALLFYDVLKEKFTQ